MMMVALIMRPWIIIMRSIPDVTAYILADDVLVVATGGNMVQNIAEAINQTHGYLHSMGAKVAPDKSYNFASTEAARRWLADTWWEGINDKIAVVKDFRYLGAHITTARSCVSSTLDKRWEEAMVQLKRLKFAPATIDAKCMAIKAKIYAAAMYGVEAAEVSPQKVAKLTAAVINVFRSRNNNHNVDRFFTTLTPDKQELDPMVEIFARRAMQIRRTICKQRHMEEKYKRMLKKYADQNKEAEVAPAWFQELDQKDRSTNQRPTRYPPAQPHPSSNQYDPVWKKGIKVKGPMGLLIESIIWHGLVIDQNLRIWQSNEEPIDLINMPIQSLKVMLQATAARARTRAEWCRGSSKTIATREIDRDASQPDPKMESDKQGFVRTVMMGGNQAKQEIAAYNEDVDTKCDLCGKAISTSDHTKWGCEALEATRVEADPEIAAIPRKYLPLSVRCCIAPAMQTSGLTTYWGRELDDDVDEKTHKSC